MGLEREKTVRLTIALACALLGLSLSAGAGCKELAAAVEDAIKDSADLEARGAVGDRSAPAELARLQRVSNNLAAVQSNLLMMDRAKCPMPSLPVGTGNLNPYSAAAGRCVSTRSGDDCQQENWKRNK